MEFSKLIRYNAIVRLMTLSRREKPVTRSICTFITLAWLAATSPEIFGWSTSAPILPATQDRLSGNIAIDDDGTVHVFWHERVGGYFQCFHTRGVSGAFATPVAISQGGSIHCYGPTPAIDATGLHVVWTSDQAQNNNFEIYYRLFGGTAWGPILNASNTSIKSLGQAVAARSPVGPVVCWQEALYADDNYDVMYSEWNGSGFTPAVNLSNTPYGQVYGSVEPGVAISPGGDVTVVWPERITGEYHMNARRRVGGVWSPREQISSVNVGPSSPSVVAGPDGQVHVTYCSDEGTITAYYQKWNGSAWTAPFDLSRGFPNFWRASMTVDEQGFVHVVADNAQGNPQGEIWYSTNRSGAWSNWVNISNTPNKSSVPVITYGAGQLYVIWSDDGNGSGGASGFLNVWHTRTALQPIGPAGHIIGTVRDQHGAGVANATISAGIYEIATGPGGQYDLLVAPDTYTVSANKAGYNGQSADNIVVTDGNSTTVDFDVQGIVPEPVTSLSLTAGNTSNTLSWINSASDNCSGTLIRYKTTGYPTGPTDGILVVDLPGAPGEATNHTHTDLTNGTTCYYAAFAYFRDASTFYATGATAEGTPAGPADLDCDGDVDQSDFGTFQACLSGDYEPQTEPACQRALLDGDNDVDENDLVLFIGCISGPGVPADPHCDVGE